MYLKHQSQLAQSLLSCSTAFSILLQGRGTYSSFTLLQIYFEVRQDSKVDNFENSLFLLLIIIRSGLLGGIKWSVCMLKSHRSLCVSFSKAGAGLCIYHLFVLSNLNSRTFPSGSPCRPSRVSPYTPSVLICCIRLLCDWSFRLCHRIAYIYCFVASCLIIIIIIIE